MKRFIGGDQNRAVAIWLFTCAALVFAMVVVGGITRLTGSGLSITEWKPIMGALPPMNAADWNEAFGKYRAIPQYAQVNAGMSLAEFQGIFWWEWAHRLSGRLIGVVFFLPYVWFLVRGQLRGTVAAKVFGFFILGGLQGAMGWYMVKSGLVDNPHVSQYRLTAHLSLAFVIFIAMMWVALGLIEERSHYFAHEGYRRLQRLGFWLFLLACYMVVTGGFVAGIRAGKAYNTFPLMNGHVLPPESFIIDPWYLNFFNNMALVQFDHRLGAWLLAFLVPWFFVQVRAADVSSRARLAATLLLVALAIQISLGIATLLLAVPVALGAAHQGGSMLVFAALIWLNHELRVARTPLATT